MFKKVSKILIQSLPILVMIGLIPLIQNDWILGSIYLLIIGVSFFLRYNK